MTTTKTTHTIMKHLKLIMAALLLLCLFKMPYGYYTLLRFAAMVAFAVMAVKYNEKKHDVLTVTFGAIALLFQPFFKVALGRGTWNVVDVAVAALLIALWIREQKPE